jgi:hypothetical protein
MPTGAVFWSMTVTKAEISVICLEGDEPRDSNFNVERAWKGLKVAGPLDFELKGILASLLNPLADAGVSVFALSTYDTDYLFVKEFDLEKSLNTLHGKGHAVVT